MNILRTAAITSAALALGMGGVAHASGGGHSDDNRTGYYGSSNTTSAPAVSSSKLKGAHKQVLAKEVNSTYLFAAKTVTVKVGTTITWSNRSDAEHNVTFDKNSKVNMDFEPNRSVSYTFTRTGTFRYHCEYHPFMKGMVVVHA